jgi:hypothetical protein
MVNFFRNMFEKIRRPAGARKMDPSKAMMEMMARTADEEIDCDTAFDRLNEYAEMFARGEDVSRILPAVHRHIELCKDCREEFQALLRAIQVKQS